MFWKKKDYSNIEKELFLDINNISNTINNKCTFVHLWHSQQNPPFVCYFVSLFYNELKLNRDCK